MYAKVIPVTYLRGWGGVSSQKKSNVTFAKN